MPAIDQLCYSSKLRRVNAAEKSAFAVLTLLLCVASQSIVIALIVLAVNSICTVTIGKTPSEYYIKLMLIPVTFLIMSTLAIIINISPHAFDAYAIGVGGYYITASKASLLFAVQLILTALAAVSSLYFLALSTPVTDIAAVLEKLRCPAIVVELMMLTYRFIFILLSVASAILVSQRSRLGYKDYPTSVRSFASLGAMLLIRAIKRANGVFSAMESRGYNGRICVLKEEYPARKKEILLILLFELILIGIWIGEEYI